MPTTACPTARSSPEGRSLRPTDVKIKSTLGGDFRVMHVPNSEQAIVQQVTIEPGAQTGWHSHHGPVFVVVAAGTMTLYQADDPTCTGETYSAGQVFVDPGQGRFTTPATTAASASCCTPRTSTFLARGAAIPGANPGTCTGF